MDTVIIKNGDKYYFTNDDRVYELNEKTMSRLRIHLSLPSKVYFKNCPFTSIGNLISSVFQEPVESDVKMVNGSDFVGIFTKVKKVKM